MKRKTRVYWQRALQHAAAKSSREASRHWSTRESSISIIKNPIKITGNALLHLDLRTKTSRFGTSWVSFGNCPKSQRKNSRQWSSCPENPPRASMTTIIKK